MTFTATALPLAIDHKLKGKIYNVHPLSLAAARAGNPGVAMSSDPFDTHLIAPGASWVLPDGAEFIRQREMSGV